MQKILSLLLLVGVLAVADTYEDGKNLFWEKCAICHVGHIDSDKIKENFEEHNNTVLMLGSPTVNMLAEAIVHGPRHIGDPNEPGMQQTQIEKFLVKVLYEPDAKNSICDPKLMKYYGEKTPMKERLSPKEITLLAQYFMDYKAPPEIKKKKANKSGTNQY